MRATTLPLAVTAYTATSALGLGLDAHLRALAGQRSGLRENDLGVWRDNFLRDLAAVPQPR